MIKRIIEISSQPLHLSVRDEQLRLHEPGCSAEAPIRSVPCEDIGVVVIEHPQATFSQAAMARLADYGAVVVFCGRNHLPVALSVPVSGNTEVAARLRDQIEASKPVQKRIWRDLIRGKIAAQADNLDHAPIVQRKLRVLRENVRSGDLKNVEAHAARLYWQAWLTGAQRAATLGGDRRFRRDTDGDGLNALLNYGYAILRAAVARALVAAGLQPALGIHHSNRSNAFALADDLLEPLRPAVDRIVQALADEGNAEIDPQTKRALLSLLHTTVAFEKQTGPLMVVLHRYTAAFLRCLRGRDKSLAVPCRVDDRFPPPMAQMSET